MVVMPTTVVTHAQVAEHSSEDQFKAKLSKLSIAKLDIVKLILKGIENIIVVYLCFFLLRPPTK